MRPQITIKYVATTATSVNSDSVSWLKALKNFITWEVVINSVQILALLMLILTVCCYVWLALLQRQANRNAATANEIAKQALTASHTPWISIKPISIAYQANPDNSQDLFLTLELTNCSEYPAFAQHIECTANCPNSHDKSVSIPDFVHDSAVLMPHVAVTQVIKMSSYNAFKEPIVPSALDLLTSKKIPISLEFIYRDIDQRVFTFREYIATDGEKFWSFRPRIFGPGVTDAEIKDSIEMEKGD